MFISFHILTVIVHIVNPGHFRSHYLFLLRHINSLAMLSLFPLIIKIELLFPIGPSLDQHGYISGGRVPELPHQRNQYVRQACLSEERVVQQLSGGGALCGVADQHLV